MVTQLFTFVAVKKFNEKKIQYNAKGNDTGKKASSVLGIDIILAQRRYNNITTSFMKQANST